jgi:hypothetical protein
MGSGVWNDRELHRGERYDMRNRLLLLNVLILLLSNFGLSVLTWHDHQSVLAIVNGVMFVVNLNTLRMSIKLFMMTSWVQLRTR